MKKQFFILLLLMLIAFVSYGQTYYYKGIKVGAKTSTTAVKIDSISYVGGTLKFYRGSTNMLPAGDSFDSTAMNNRLETVEESLTDTVTLESVAELLENREVLYPSMDQHNAKADTAAPTFGKIRMQHSYAGNYIIGNTTASITGTDNIIIGTTAGRDLTSGSSNIAIGGRALTSTAAGSGNVAIGYQAMYLGTAGSNNTVIGTDAGRAITTSGASNGLFGYRAGYKITSGTYNIISGYEAGFEVSTGTSNVIIGSNACKATNTSRNICIGHAAGQNLTLSDRLVFDNVSRADDATNASNAIIYGIMATNAVDQRLSINAVLKLALRADPPDTPAEGMIYADTDHHLYYYNGTAWVQLDN